MFNFLFTTYNDYCRIVEQAKKQRIRDVSRKIDGGIKEFWVFCGNTF